MNATVPAWVPLAAAFIAALAAICGAFVAPLIQRRNNKEEAERAKRLLLLTKAEDIFVELARLRDTLNQINISVLTDELGVEKDESTKPVAFEISRIRALVRMYFPSGIRIIDDYQQNASGIAAPLAKSVLAKGENKSAELPDVSVVRIQIGHMSAKMLDSLEEFMEKQVAALL